MEGYEHEFLTLITSIPFYKWGEMKNAAELQTKLIMDWSSHMRLQLGQFVQLCNNSGVN